MTKIAAVAKVTVEIYLDETSNLYSAEKYVEDILCGHSESFRAFEITRSDWTPEIFLPRAVS